MPSINEHHACTSTKGARESLYRRIESIATKCGATAERCDAPREIVVRLYLRGYYAVVFLDGASRVGAFMIHWVSDGALFDGRFAVQANTSLVARPHYKATTVVEGLHDFYRALEGGLTFLASQAETAK